MRYSQRKVNPKSCIALTARLCTPIERLVCVCLVFSDTKTDPRRGSSNREVFRPARWL